MTLAAFGGAVRLEVAGVVHDRFEAEREAIIAAAPARTVVAIPTDEPVRFLRLFEACLVTGRAALPMPGKVIVPRRDLPETDASLVLATSGSSGEPKLACFSLDAVIRSAHRIAGNLGLVRDDVVAVLSPLHHAYGLVGQLLAGAAAGARVVWARSAFADEQIAALGHATVLSSVASGLRRLVEAGIEPRAVRLVCSAGGRFPAATRARVAERFPRATLVNQYGCTEAGPRLTACRSDDPAFARGAVGPPIEGVTLTVDDGEIVFSTETAMTGYLGERPCGPVIRTGDLGRLEGGVLYVEGRKDAVVKIRGEKVALDQVAAAAEAAGATAACAVVSEIDGDDALVLVVEGADLTRRGLAPRLPLEALPDRIERVASLPRLASGKIDRRAVRESLRDHPR